LRYSVSGGGDRLLLVNLGRDLNLRQIPEPLLAPPSGMQWSVHWSSEAWDYGGGGFPFLQDEETGWHIPGEAAAFLVPMDVSERMQ
jgi:maltooligosyltrehalose trehalohydrolase